MNTDTLQLIGQILLIGLGPLLAKHGVTFGNAEVDKIVGGAATVIGIIWKFWHWNATPSAPAASQPVNIPITKIAPLLALMAVSLYFVGCAAIQPGNDPLIVNVERTETIAKGTFDDVLGIDNANRAFFRTNAPAFHNFCEWLRAPQTVPDETSTNGALSTLPRCSAMLVSLDEVKLAYKNSRASSNEVFTALATVQSAMNQANSWMTVTTNQPSTH